MWNRQSLEEHESFSPVSFWGNAKVRQIFHDLQYYRDVDLLAKVRLVILVLTGIFMTKPVGRLDSERITRGEISGFNWATCASETVFLRHISRTLIGFDNLIVEKASG